MLIKQSKNIRYRILYSIAAIIIGAIILAIGLYFTFHPFAESSQADFGTGFMVGGGGSMVLVGLFLLVQALIALRDPKRLKEFEIKENDERSQAIIDKACKWTFLILAMGMTFASIIFAVLNFTVLITLVVCLWVAILIFAVSYLIVRHKM
ncbi:hypothetical protein [Zongyangia hominis]|uniref:DUF2178 domain-containing protein n=1 Tax=Zongyangia hominis TaxID=2763677 RepID=A0A926I5Y8_9FIRM|nr:hypothetical protein [Zongyangia hominis]MBC8569414.1 hypothetical protein [Zongyangia hominis]